MKFREKLTAFMAGRYGGDVLNTVLLTFSLIMFLVSSAVGTASSHTGGRIVSGVLFLVALAALVFALFRTLSRSLVKRRAEYDWFMQKLAVPVMTKRNEMKTRAAQRKTHKFFRCPGCGKTLRVPKGKGKLRITCPDCGKSFEKET